MASLDGGRITMGERLAFLGPAGTFSEEAARSYSPDAELVAFPTITATARAVLTGDADEAVTPIENSLQGAVPDTLDLLIHEPGLHVRRELAIPIVHNLMAKPGTRLSDIRMVYSHPQALGQCQGFLQRELPYVEVAAALSTAAAVEQALNGPEPAAAIAPRRAAQIYGADLLAEGIQDHSNNVTRFVVLGKTDSEPTGDDKTSICFSFEEDKPGQLYRVMGVFAEANINLTKVESRPTRMGLGRYYFLLDLEGHREDPKVSMALAEVKEMVSSFRVFGSYPRFALENSA